MKGDHKKKNEDIFVQAVSGHPAFPEAARREMAQMREVIAKGNANIDGILDTNQSATVKGGFMAEEYHAETFNLDAVYKGDDSRAYTDRYNEWKHLKHNGDYLKKNDVADVIIVKDNNITKSAQLKYYDSAERTAEQMSQVKDGAPKYETMDQLIGPEDQINHQYKDISGKSESVATTTISEHAEAKANALHAQGGDPTKESAYRQTAQKATDKLSNDQSSSSALSKSDADRLGSGDRTKLQKIESDYQTKSTFKQMGNAAVSAGVGATIVSGSVNTLRCIQKVRNGEMTADEATIEIVKETVAAAADSAVKASANAGVQSLMIRYGSEEAALQVLAKRGLDTMLKSSLITAAVTSGVDMVKDLVRLGAGEISTQEFYDRQGKGILQTSAGAAGGAVGVSAASTVASALGASRTLASIAEVIGGFSGGLIAGLAMQMAIENGVEKPYRDLLRNTQNFQETASEFVRVAERMSKSQLLFGEYIKIEQQMQREFDGHLERIHNTSQRIQALRQNLQKYDVVYEKQSELLTDLKDRCDEARARLETTRPPLEDAKKLVDETGRLAWEAISRV